MNKMNRPPVPPVLVLGLGVLAVSSSSILIRFAQREVHSLVIAAWRLSLATIVLIPFVLKRRSAELAAFTRAEFRLAALSGLFLALHFASWISSLAFTSVASSVVLVATAPLWVSLLSPITLKEPLSRRMMIGLLFALAGGIVVGISDSCMWSATGLICQDFSALLRGKAFLGNALALFGALSAAGYLIIGRKLRKGVSLLSYIFLVYGIAALALMASAIAVGLPLFDFSPLSYLWLLGLALIPQLIGHTSYNWALAYLSAAFVSIAVLGEPVGSSILAYYLLNEKITIYKLVGAALTLAGIILASRGEQDPPSLLNDQ